MSSYRKALKNYRTKASAAQSVAAIQQILMDFGATGIGWEYEEGQVSSIGFKIEIEGTSRVVQVPLLVKNVAQVLQRQKQTGPKDYAYRVALANVRDWLDSQLAYEATKQVKFEQIFLPYMVDPSTGKNFYQLVSENKFALPNNS